MILTEGVYGIKVGEIFVSEWGYDQTNATFYQVVKVSPKSITVRRIAGRETPRALDQGGSMYGVVVPVKNGFDGPPLLKRPYLFNGKVLFRTSSYSGGAERWDGKPVEVSHTG